MISLRAITAKLAAAVVLASGLTLVAAPASHAETYPVVADYVVATPAIPGDGWKNVGVAYGTDQVYTLAQHVPTASGTATYEGTYVLTSAFNTTPIQWSQLIRLPDTFAAQSRRIQIETYPGGFWVASDTPGARSSTLRFYRADGTFVSTRTLAWPAGTDLVWSYIYADGPNLAFAVGEPIPNSGGLPDFRLALHVSTDAGSTWNSSTSHVERMELGDNVLLAFTGTSVVLGNLGQRNRQVVSRVIVWSGNFSSPTMVDKSLGLAPNNISVASLRKRTDGAWVMNWLRSNGTTLDLVESAFDSAWTTEAGVPGAEVIARTTMRPADLSEWPVMVIGDTFNYLSFDRDNTGLFRIEADGTTTPLKAVDFGTGAAGVPVVAGERNGMYYTLNSWRLPSVAAVPRVFYPASTVNLQHSETEDGRTFSSAFLARETTCSIVNPAGVASTTMYGLSRSVFPSRVAGLSPSHSGWTHCSIRNSVLTTPGTWKLILSYTPRIIAAGEDPSPRAVITHITVAPSGPGGGDGDGDSGDDDGDDDNSGDDGDNDGGDGPSHVKIPAIAGPAHQVIRATTASFATATGASVQWQRATLSRAGLISSPVQAGTSARVSVPVKSGARACVRARALKGSSFSSWSVWYCATSAVDDRSMKTASKVQRGKKSGAYKRTYSALTSKKSTLRAVKASGANRITIQVLRGAKKSSFVVKVSGRKIATVNVPRGKGVATYEIRIPTTGKVTLGGKSGTTRIDTATAWGTFTG